MIEMQTHQSGGRWAWFETLLSRLLPLFCALLILAGCWGSAGPVDPTPYDEVTFEHGERPRVRVETSLGTLTLELLPDVAYTHCQNFVYLARLRFYDGLLFHRIIKGFVIQGGDPTGTGTGGPGYLIPPEYSDLPFERGTVGAVRIGTDTLENGSQFFIALGRLRVLDGKYTVFGQVVNGEEALDAISEVSTGRGDRPQTPVIINKIRMLP